MDESGWVRGWIRSRVSASETHGRARKFDFVENEKQELLPYSRSGVAASVFRVSA